MSTTFTRTLAIAAKILGGVERLEKHLGVNSMELSSWMRGYTNPPHEVFLRAVDVLLEDNGY